MKRLVGFVLACAIPFVGGCGKQENSSDKIVCEDFRSLAGDIRDGVVTGPELVKRTRELRDESVGGSDAVVSAATDAARSAVDVSSSSAVSAFVELDSACKASGF